jgi:N-acetylglucosaminyldiphosphoundecaprenol N-acetyl-beta-D-mannosaminyltransferase
VPTDQTTTRDRLSLGALRFDSLTAGDVVEAISRDLERGVGGTVITPNVDILRQCETSPVLAELVNGASMVVADGMPVVWASHIAGSPLPERLAGSDLVPLVVEQCARTDRRICFFGGGETVAAAAAARFASGFAAHRRPVAVTPPHVSGGFDDAAIDEFARMLQRNGCDVVFLGLGFPKQERLMLELSRRLPGTWFLGVGAALDFEAGRISRAPQVMRKVGLEWLFRLAMEPRRLYRRYLVEDGPFLVRFLGRLAVTRVRPRQLIAE